MPRKKITHRIEVMFRQDRGGNDLAGFLDMLRYDQSKVETWNIDKDTSIVSATLARESLPHTIDRWHSFGINVAVLSSRDY